MDKLRIALARQSEDTARRGLGDDDRGRQALLLLRLNKDVAAALQQAHAMADAEVCVYACVRRCMHECVYACMCVLACHVRGPSNGSMHVITHVVVHEGRVGVIHVYLPLF